MMKTDMTRWSIIGDDTEKKYTDAYGEAGKRFVEVLETSPYEIAVISCLLNYLHCIRNKK